MPQVRYTTGAMVLHWLIAIAVIVNWRIAEAAEHAESPLRGEIMANHKALGVTILILTLLRLAWRLTHKTPPFASTVKPWEAALARTVHIIFYVLLIGMPLAGWLGNSLYGQAVDVFGLFTLPALPVGEDRDMGGQIFDIHAAAGTLMLALIVLHVVGALKHHLLDRDGNLYRMLPVGRPKA